MWSGTCKDLRTVFRGFSARAFPDDVRRRASAGQKQSVAQFVNGVVTDAFGPPAARATVTLESADGNIIAQAITDDRGLFRLPQRKAGTYALVTRRKGFKPGTMIVVLPQSAQKRLDLVLESREALTVPVIATRMRAQNGMSASGTSKYTLTARDIANLPEGEATPLNQVMLQMPGVALDQNQEIHIRGEHMGIQYQMNGILLPLDINTDPTFTQLLNSYFIKSVSLMDGVLPAQYGYRTSGVIDIHTKDGCGGGRNEFTIPAGSATPCSRVSSLADAMAISATTLPACIFNPTWDLVPRWRRRTRFTTRLSRGRDSRI